MDQFPGYDFAIEKGFTLHHFSGNHSSASYVNEDGIFLDITKQNDGSLIGKLNFMYKLLTISSGEFSIPNKNFYIFFNQIISAYDYLDIGENK